MSARASGSASFFDADKRPELRDRLASDLRRYLVSTSRLEWGPSQAHALFAQWSSGWLSPILWNATESASHGLALGQRRPEGLRIHGLWLDPPGPASLDTFLRDAEASPYGTLQVLTDVLAEVPDDEQDALLRPRGFWHREKVRLRRPPDAPPPRPALDPRIRPVRREDAEALVVLYARAYRERTGEFWIAEAADPDADARENVGTFFDGAGGWAPSFLPAASHVCEEDGRVVGAILVEARDDGAAYVADVMVDPERQRRGIGRRLVERALAEVTRAGPRAVELAAYRFGAPYRLYRSLGFEDLPRPEGRLDGQWVRGPDPLRAVAGSREP